MSQKAKKFNIPKPSKKEHYQIPKEVTELTKGYLTEGNHAHVMLSIQLIQHEYECFSSWDKDEMGIFWDFNRRIHNITWQELIRSGGKKGKRKGLGFNPAPKDKMPSQSLFEKYHIDTMQEMRIDQRKRIFGFRHKNIFYICFLDKNHDILKSK